MTSARLQSSSNVNKANQNLSVNQECKINKAKRRRRRKAFIVFMFFLFIYVSGSRLLVAVVGLDYTIQYNACLEIGTFNSYELTISPSLIQ